MDVELDQMQETDYIPLKTPECFRFGVKRFIWVFSPARQVIVAEPSADWRIIEWDKEVELMGGVSVNIGHYLRQEGVSLEGQPEHE